MLPFTVFRFFRMTLLFAGLILAGVLAAQEPLPALSWQTENIAPGAVWKKAHTDRLFDGWQHLNVLEIDPRKRKFGLAFSADTLRHTSTFGAEAGAIAAVNAGFFDMSKGGSVTLLKADGKLINRSQEKLIQDKAEILRGALIIGRSKKMQVLPAGADSDYERGKYRTVLLTGPLLLSGGKPVELAKRPFNDNRHPRTCVCITEEKKVLLLTADGRSNQAYGLSLPELTRLLQSLGCRDAVNLDGGGSTTMWIRNQPYGGIVNMPSDNKQFDHLGERRVANAVLVF